MSLPVELWGAILEAALEPDLVPTARQSLLSSFRLVSSTFLGVANRHGELVLTAPHEAARLAASLGARIDQPPTRILWVQGPTACEDLRAVVRAAGTGIRELRLQGRDADGDSLLRCLYPGLFPVLETLVIGPSVGSDAGPVVTDWRLFLFAAKCCHLRHIVADANWAPREDVLPFMPPSDDSLSATCALTSFTASDWGGLSPSTVLLPVFSNSHASLRHLVLGGRNHSVPADLVKLLARLTVLETLSLPHFRGHWLVESPGCLQVFRALRTLEVHEPTRSEDAFYAVVVRMPALRTLTLRLVSWERAKAACENLAIHLAKNGRVETQLELRLVVLSWELEVRDVLREREAVKFVAGSREARTAIETMGGFVRWCEITV